MSGRVVDESHIVHNVGVDVPIGRHVQSVDPVNVSGRVVSDNAEAQDFVTTVEVVHRDTPSPDCGAPLKAVRPVRPVVDSIRPAAVGSDHVHSSHTLLDDAHFANWVLQAGSDTL
nr:uncharacterized protein LOC109189836 [Ipomoea batatas]